MSWTFKHGARPAWQAWETGSVPDRIFPCERCSGAASQVNLSSAVRRIRCGVIIHKVVPSSSPCGHKNAVCRFGGRRRDVVLLFHKKYDSSWTMNLVLPALDNFPWPFIIIQTVFSELLSRRLILHTSPLNNRTILHYSHACCTFIWIDTVFQECDLFSLQRSVPPIFAVAAWHSIICHFLCHPEKSLHLFNKAFLILLLPSWVWQEHPLIHFFSFYRTVLYALSMSLVRTVNDGAVSNEFPNLF